MRKFVLPIFIILSAGAQSTSGQALRDSCVDVENINQRLIEALDVDLLNPCDNNAWIQLSSIRPDKYGAPKIRDNIGVASEYYFLSRSAIFSVNELGDMNIGARYYFLASHNPDLNRTGHEEKRAVYALLYMETVGGYHRQHFNHILSRFNLPEIDVNCFAKWDIPSFDFREVIQSSNYATCEREKL